MKTLREIRTEKGFSQESLAKEAGVSIQVLAKLEWRKGRGDATSVQIGNCKRVADTLGISMDEMWDAISTFEESPKQGNNILKWKSKETK